MSLRDPYQRRSSSSCLGRGLLIVLILVVGIAVGVAGHWLLQRTIVTGRDNELLAEMAALRADLQTANDRLSAMESRLAAIEASDTAGQLAGMQATVDGLRADLARLKQSIQAQPGAATGQASASALPPEVHLSIARQSQSRSLSCESSAASMAANYLGVALSEGDILAALPRNDNPHRGFRGNMDGPTGSIEDYGVYAEPIAAVLNSRGLRATLVDGGLAGIKAALARGDPVVAWVTYNCIVSPLVTQEIDGRQVVLVPYEHAVVVTGYNDSGVWANDPYDGQEDFYSTADFERAMGYFGDMAIEVAAP